MYTFSGIVYRIWAVAVIFFLIGVGCIVRSRIGKMDFDKECCLIGTFGVLFGIFLAICYTMYIVFPNVNSFHGVFYKEYSNSRVAPPLPFTIEYNFYDDSSEIRVCYLDVFSKKEIIPEGFILDEEYIIYYEANTKVIVGVEKDSSQLLPNASGLKKK